MQYAFIFSLTGYLGIQVINIIQTYGYAFIFSLTGYLGIQVKLHICAGSTK
jgi:hypothetical protein